MTTLENKQLLQHIFAELAQGNSRPLVESMSDDFCWTVTERQPVVGNLPGQAGGPGRIAGPAALQD